MLAADLDFISSLLDKLRSRDAKEISRIDAYCTLQLQPPKEWPPLISAALYYCLGIANGDTAHFAEGNAKLNEAFLIIDDINTFALFYDISATLYLRKQTESAISLLELTLEKLNATQSYAFTNHLTASINYRLASYKMTLTPIPGDSIKDHIAKAFHGFLPYLLDNDLEDADIQKMALCYYFFRDYDSMIGVAGRLANPDAFLTRLSSSLDTRSRELAAVLFSKGLLRLPSLASVLRKAPVATTSSVATTSTPSVSGHKRPREEEPSASL